MTSDIANVAPQVAKQSATPREDLVTVIRAVMDLENAAGMERLNRLEIGSVSERLSAIPHLDVSNLSWRQRASMLYALGYGFFCKRSNDLDRLVSCLWRIPEQAAFQQAEAVLDAYLIGAKLTGLHAVFCSALSARNENQLAFLARQVAQIAGLFADSQYFRREDNTGALLNYQNADSYCFSRLFLKGEAFYAGDLLGVLDAVQSILGLPAGSISGNDLPFSSIAKFINWGHLVDCQLQSTGEPSTIKLFELPNSFTLVKKKQHLKSPMELSLKVRANEQGVLSGYVTWANGVIDGPRIHPSLLDLITDPSICELHHLKE